MDFLINKSTPLPGETAVTSIGEVASRALDNYADEAKRAFGLLWSDPASTQDKLDRMGTHAGLAFSQHYDTVLHLLRSYARAIFGTVLASASDLDAALADPPTWLLTNAEHPLSQAVLSKMPPATWMPPAEYTINADGTVTLQ